jgi:uncharacterized protein YndB with AHSA1/START domain
MWKWIVGVALLVVVVVGGTCWYAFHKLTSGGSVSTVTIGGSPAHVFAMLADRDSMSLWLEKGTRSASGQGMLAVGDTAWVDSSSHTGRNGELQRMAWMVTEMVPGQLLVTEVRDTASRMAFVRRDSLAAAGDSTILTSSFSMPGLDSIRLARGDTSRAATTLEKIMLSAFRLRADLENGEIKSHIEGKPATTAH